MTKIATRDWVFFAVSGERDHQDARAAECAVNGEHEIATYLTFIRDYLTDAEHITTHNWSVTASRQALVAIRKITALGIACMEQHGAPLRELPAVEAPAECIIGINRVVNPWWDTATPADAPAHLTSSAPHETDGNDDVYSWALSPRSLFGFHVGERVNMRGSPEGSNPGTVTGFPLGRVGVRWDLRDAVGDFPPSLLRHGI